MRIYTHLLQYGVTYRQEHAHEEGIWCVSWVKNVARDVDYLVTGAADNMVKAWTWYVCLLSCLLVIQSACVLSHPCIYRVWYVCLWVWQCEATCDQLLVAMVTSS